MLVCKIATVNILKKPSKKKITAILFLIALLIAMFPDVQSDTPIVKPSPDYGVYSAMEEIQDEKNSRINTPEILNETQGRFDNMTIITEEEKFDLESGREVVSPDITAPQMLSIYNAMIEWDQFNNSEIIKWILPPPFGSGTPAQYYIYTKYITNETVIEEWTDASLRWEFLTPDLLHLSTWWQVDVDDDSIDDIELRFVPAMEWTLGELINRITGDPIEVGVTLHYDIRRLYNDPDPFTIPGFMNLEVFIAKSMSYFGKNFILFLGLNFTDVLSAFNASVTVSKVGIGGLSVSWFPLPPSINWDETDILNLVGPYYLNWNYPSNEVLSAFSLEIATARIEFTDDPGEPYEFLNLSWVDVDFNKRTETQKVPSSAELMVDADDDLSSFNRIEWNAERACDVFARFFDSQQNVTYAEIEINNFVDEIYVTMDVVEKHGRNVTIINYTAPGGVINYVDVHHYEFFDVAYQDLTQDKIDNGEIEYIHLFLNISRIPRRLYLEGIFYLEEIESTPNISPGFGMVAQFVDMAAQRVISRFTRIAKTLSSIPYRLLSIAEEGSFATIDTFGIDDIDSVEFVFTSGDYVTTTGNYFAFYNNTHQSNYPIAQISLSGRITNVKYFNASFEEDAFTEIEMMEGERFRALYVDDINSMYAEMNISNFPGRITLLKAADALTYDGGDTSIEEVRFVSDYKGSYMDFRVHNLAKQLFVEYDDDRTFVSTGSPSDSIGEIEFLVSTGPILRREGNHLLLRQEPDYSVLSGRIRDITKLEYISGENGKLEAFFARENVLNISLFDNRSEKIMADLIIDPMPSYISVNLSSLFAGIGTNFSLPRLDSTGVLGLVHLIFGVAAMGNEIMGVIDEATQEALSNIGNIIQDLSFSYSTTIHITLIGKILRGDAFTMDDVDWMHGISAKQQVTAQGTSMVAKLYFSGLPTQSIISTRVKGDDIVLDLCITDFQPKHDWLCIDVRGIQDRDVMLYVNNVSNGMDLDLSVDLLAQISTMPPKAIGNIHMDSNKAIGALYGRMRQTIPEITITEFYLSSLPRILHTQFNLSGNISINFQGNTGIEHMFVKNTRARNEEFHDIYAILHQLPDQTDVSISPVIDYDMDASALHTLPTISIESSGSTLDAFIFADGKGIGQIGIAEVQVVNAPDTFSGEFSDDKYQVKSTGVDYFWVHVMELPIMEGHKTKSIEIVGKDILSFDVTVGTLFGNYPIIGMENSKGGEIQYIFEHEMDGSKAGMAFIDFKTTNGLPSSPSILINGGSVDLEKGSSHLMVPAPILTLYLTIFS